LQANRLYDLEDNVKKKTKNIIVWILVSMVGLFGFLWLLTGGYAYPGGETTEKYEKFSTGFFGIPDETTELLWEKVWLDHDYRDISGHGSDLGYNGKEYKDGNYDTYYTLKNAANGIDKDIEYEHVAIYHIEKSSNYRYVSPPLITNKLDELNRMLSVYPDVVEITVYRMNDFHFTEEEIRVFISRLNVPENCRITMTVWEPAQW